VAGDKVGVGVGAGTATGDKVASGVGVGVAMAVGVEAASGVGVGVGTWLTDDRLQLKAREPMRKRNNTRKQLFGFRSIVKNSSVQNAISTLANRWQSTNFAENLLLMIQAAQNESR
jgi:hypothetical protein